MKGLTGVLQTVLLKLRAEFFSRIAFICEFVFEIAMFLLVEHKRKEDSDCWEVKWYSDFLTGSGSFSVFVSFSLETIARWIFLGKSTKSSKETTTFEGKEYPVIKVATSSTSHPFYTGKSKFVDETGRVDKFKKKYNL